MKKKKGKKIVFIIIAVLIVLIILGLWACGKAASSAVSNIVETTQPETGTIEEIVSLSGVVESEEVKTYFAPVNGELLEVSVEAGDMVKAGDMLVTYNMDEMSEILEQARLQYTSGNNTYNDSMADSTDAQKKLKEANTRLAQLEKLIKEQKAYVKAMHEQLSNVQTERADAFADKDLEMQKTMIELQKDPIKNANAISQLQLAMQDNQYASQKVASTEDLIEYQKSIEAEEEKLAEYEKEKAEMEAQKQSAEMGTLTEYQKDNLSVSEQLNLMTYENAQEDYALAEQGIAADFDGIVTSVSAIDGMPVAENTQLVTVANSNEVRVNFYVSKYDLARIAIGQKADIEISGNTYTGSITKINKMAETTATGNAQVGAQIHIDNPDDQIYIGLDAKIKIYANKAENVLLIPVSVLNADKEGDFVYVEENGVAVRKDVVTGISTTEQIEVKEGLSASDKVIVSGLLPLEEGMTVMSQAELMPE
ncbi:MAG: efflux RND transporter periplasmic adaptor subunit [Lachnospiraceae bacterium]|nr:efflux RND transporter periplasmic adaptor subunit [Lachnospiraceae bacterium]